VDVVRTATVAPNGILKSGGQVLTAEAVKAIIERTLLARGCTARETIVAVGPQGARPHDTGSGPLRAGVPLVLDIFPRDQATGYWGDITRTLVRGRAPDRIRRLHRDVLAAQQIALAMVRPGTEVRTIQRAVEDFFRRAGHETRLAPPGRECGFIHSVGHGVGLDIHEAPGVRRAPGRLQTGHVVTIEPGLYYPGVGGVRIEDTVVVTRTGHKILASFPKKLET
jgi:Xaa-Pro aminopeptidase